MPMYVCFLKLQYINVQMQGKFLETLTAIPVNRMMKMKRMTFILLLNTEGKKKF